MIDLTICAKCPKCVEFLPSKLDKEGRLALLPSVACDVANGMLLGNSTLPDGCLYALEQMLLEDRAFDEFENLRDEEENDNTT